MDSPAKDKNFSFQPKGRILPNLARYNCGQHVWYKSGASWAGSAHCGHGQLQSIHLLNSTGSYLKNWVQTQIDM